MKFVKFFEDGIKYIGCEDGRLFQGIKGEYVELSTSIPQPIFLSLCDDHKVYDFDGELSPSNINYAMCVRNASTNIRRSNIPRHTSIRSRNRVNRGNIPFVQGYAAMHRH